MLGLALCLLLGPLAGEGPPWDRPLPSGALPSILRSTQQCGSGLGCLADDLPFPLQGPSLCRRGQVSSSWPFLHLHQ